MHSSKQFQCHEFSHCYLTLFHIHNRKSTMRFPSCHRWTLSVTPKSPKGWLKMRIFTLCVAFHIFVSGNRRHFKFGMWVEHSKSQPTDDKPSLKWAWSLSRDLFNFWKISDNISKTVQDNLILLNSNRKSYALYGIAMLLMTLGDP